MGSPPLPSKYCETVLAASEAKLAIRTETSSVRGVKTSTTFTHKRVNWEAENNPVLCIKLHLNPQAVSSGSLQDDLWSSA